MNRHRKIGQIILMADEGFSEIPYYDQYKWPTYGYGFVCGKQYEKLPSIRIHKDEAAIKLYEMLTDYDIEIQEHRDTSKGFSLCNDVRKAVILSMRHQLGMNGLVNFKKMWAALNNEDYYVAAKECLDSKAASEDAPKRFLRNAQMLRTGELDKYYAA